MSNKIDLLTAEQSRHLIEYRDEWLAVGRSCEPADRAAAESVWREMYAASGKPEPRVLWFDGPATGALARALLGNLGANLGKKLGASLGDNLWASLWDNLRDNLWARLGANLRDNLVDSLRDNLGDNLRDNLRANLGDNLADNLADNLGDNLRDNLWASLRDNLWANLGASLGDNLWASLGDNLRANLWANLGASLRDNLGASLRDNLRANLGDNLADNLADNLGENLVDSLRDNLMDNLRWNFWGSHESYWPAFYWWPHLALRPMHTDEQVARLQWWLTLGRSVGWWEPHENVVIACERPSRQAIDDDGFLHHESGPALLCRDGWPVYAWHGVRVPAVAIEQPELITVSMIESQENSEVKRVLIERYGWPRYLVDSGAASCDRRFNERDCQWEDLYILPDGQKRITLVDPSTGRKYALGVHREVESCEQAQAWLSHGLDRFAVHRS